MVNNKVVKRKYNFLGICSIKTSREMKIPDMYYLVCMISGFVVAGCLPLKILGIVELSEHMYIDGKHMYLQLFLLEQVVYPFLSLFVNNLVLNKWFILGSELLSHVGAGN